MEQRPISENQGVQAGQPDRVGGKGKGRGKGRRAAQLGQAANTDRATGPNGPAGAGKPERSSASAAAGSPAFHVLLDRLQRSAEELQENADAVERPSDLAGAVGRAKASLDDALSLGNDLLEAWRAEQTNTPPKKSDR